MQLKSFSDVLENDGSELVEHGSCFRRIQSTDGQVEHLVVESIGGVYQLYQDYKDGRGKKRLVLLQFDGFDRIEIASEP